MKWRGFNDEEVDMEIDRLIFRCCEEALDRQREQAARTPVAAATWPSLPRPGAGCGLRARADCRHCADALCSRWRRRRRRQSRPRRKKLSCAGRARPLAPLRLTIISAPPVAYS